MPGRFLICKRLEFHNLGARGGGEGVTRSYCLGQKHETTASCPKAMYERVRVTVSCGDDLSRHQKIQDLLHDHLLSATREISGFVARIIALEAGANDDVSRHGPRTAV